MIYPLENINSRVSHLDPEPQNWDDELKPLNWRIQNYIDEYLTFITIMHGMFWQDFWFTLLRCFTNRNTERNNLLEIKIDCFFWNQFVSYKKPLGIYDDESSTIFLDEGLVCRNKT